MHMPCQIVFNKLRLEFTGNCQRYFSGNQCVLTGCVLVTAVFSFSLPCFIGDFLQNFPIIQIEIAGNYRCHIGVVFAFYIAGGYGNILTRHIADQKIAQFVINLPPGAFDLFAGNVFSFGFFVKLIVFPDLHPVQTPGKIAEKRHQQQSLPADTVFHHIVNTPHIPLSSRNFSVVSK